MERERERHGGPSSDTVNVDVTIHGNYLGKIEVARGATLGELVEAIRARGHQLNLKEFTVMLNDRKIEVGPDGTLKENPVLTEDAALSLVKKFVGGI